VARPSSSPASPRRDRPALTPFDLADRQNVRISGRWSSVLMKVREKHVHLVDFALEEQVLANLEMARASLNSGASL
jgi:hypothetical protein